MIGEVTMKNNNLFSPNTTVAMDNVNVSTTQSKNIYIYSSFIVRCKIYCLSVMEEKQWSSIASITE